MPKDNYSNRLTSLFSGLKPLTPEPPAPPAPEPSPPPGKLAELEAAAPEAQAAQEPEQLKAALTSIESLQARIADLEAAAATRSQVIQEHERLKVALVSVGGLRARLAELEAAAKAAKSQVIEEREQRESAVASAGDLRTRLAELEAEATAAQSQVTQERQRLETVLASFGGLQARVTELEAAVVAAQSRAAQEREQRETALDTLSGLHTRLADLEAASTAAQALVVEERAQHESAQAALGSLRAQVAELEAASTQAQSQVAQEREQRESAQAALRRLQAHVVELGSASAEAQSQAVEEREQRESAQAALGNLRTHVAGLEAGVVAAQSLVAEAREQRESAQAALGNLRTHVAGLEAGAAAAQSLVVEEREQRESAQAALGSLQAHVAELEAGAAAAQSLVVEEREQREAALASLKSLEERVAELEVVATDARTRVARERERREAAIASLGGLQIRLAELEAAAAQAQPKLIQGQKSLALLADQPRGEAPLPQTGAAFPTHLPRVRFPVGIKITLPYALLALMFAMAAAYLVSRYVLESIEDRFTNQLIDTGKLTSEWMVQEESRILETLRLLANTQGLPEAIAASEAESLRTLVLPVAVNSQEEAIEVLNLQGESVLSLRHPSGAAASDYLSTRGETVFAEWDFVQKVLQGQADVKGNKYAGAVQTPWGDYFYIAGPVVDNAGRQVGVLLVGKSLLTLVREIRQNTLAHVTLYNLDGTIRASTLLLEGNASTLSADQAAQAFRLQESQSLTRDLKLSSGSYSEILGPWRARESNLGLVGTSLAESFLARPTVVTRVQALLVVTLAFLLVIAIGLYLASRITRPLQQVVRASIEVARGNFDVNVKPVGNDETAVLAHAFNYMVSGLREGSIYRDLLGRTVSPEVREELRQAFATGNLRLEGQNVVATVLMSDIRGFTTLAERADPTTILTWLNEYFHELVPIITAHGGVVDKFEGDAVLAFFGILPRPLPPPESAYQACQAAVEMLRAIENLNVRRKERGDAPLVTGVGINTGRVIAGGLGSADRMNYTIIGDTVNTAQRLESFTRQFGESGIVISQYTLSALQERQHEFHLATLGMHTFKGKSDEVLVYRLAPSQNGRAEAK